MASPRLKTGDGPHSRQENKLHTCWLYPDGEMVEISLAHLQTLKVFGQVHELLRKMMAIRRPPLAAPSDAEQRLYRDVEWFLEETTIDEEASESQARAEFARRVQEQADEAVTRMRHFPEENKESQERLRVISRLITQEAGRREWGTPPLNPPVDCFTYDPNALYVLW